MSNACRDSGAMGMQGQSVFANWVGRSRTSQSAHIPLALSIVASTEQRRKSYYSHVCTPLLHKGVGAVALQACRVSNTILWYRTSDVWCSDAPLTSLMHCSRTYPVSLAIAFPAGDTPCPHQSPVSGAWCCCWHCFGWGRPR